MAQKRKAQEAFGTPQLSAFARAKLAQQPAKASYSIVTNATEDVTDEQQESFAASVGATPYNGHHSDGIYSGAVSDEENVVEPLVKPTQIVQLSTFLPDATNSIAYSDEELHFRLPHNKSVVFVGEYDLQVLEGTVTIYGALLHASEKVHRVYAPSTHALPALVARRGDAEVVLWPPSKTMRGLSKLSPLYRKIWAVIERKPAFVPLLSSNSDPLQRPLTALNTDGEADRVIARILNESNPSTVLVAGPKSSGKSTFARILANSLLTTRKHTSCLLLDLDPGQPEVSPPGLLSLLELTEPLLGPPYTHPLMADIGPNRTVKQHAIAATSFKDDPKHFMSCALDLYNCCSGIRRHNPGVPIVINSCGWVTGTGASVLSDFADAVDLSDIVAMDPLEDSLIARLSAADPRTTLHQLSRRPAAPATRTPAELRTMQTIAYFHSLCGKATWSKRAVSEMRPWKISYAAPNPVISAIISYGQSFNPEFLAELLEGSLVAITVVEDGAIPGADPSRESASDLVGGTEPGQGMTHRTTTPEGLPYIESVTQSISTPLNPTQSRCLGLALIRAIDVTNKQFHLVTPLSQSTISALEYQSVVLVRGSFDSPDWAYLEDLHKAGDGAEELYEDGERPWVGRREMVGIEGAVWRARHPPLQGQRTG